VPENRALETRKSPQSSPAPLPPRKPRPPHHDKAEVAAGLGVLTNTEIKRLIAIAQIRVVGLSGRNGDTDAGDLLGEAALLTLNMKRKWRCGISLFNHLLATMRSIGHHRFERADKYVPISDLHPAPPPVDSVTLIAQKNIERLEQALEGDSLALAVLETLNAKIGAADAQDQLCMTPEVYWAARKRIRRRMLAVQDSSTEDNTHA
jgi:hypothetical protein